MQRERANVKSFALYSCQKRKSNAQILVIINFGKFLLSYLRDALAVSFRLFRSFLNCESIAAVFEAAIINGRCFVVVTLKPPSVAFRTHN